MTVQPSNSSAVVQNVNQPVQGNNNSEWRRFIIFFSIAIILIGLGIFAYRWLNLKSSLNDNGIVNVLGYVKVIVGDQKFDSVSSDKISRWQDLGSSYINFYLDSNKKTFVKYLPNQLTGRIDEIDVFTKFEENKSLEESKKEIENGFYNNFGFIIQPINWFTYNDENYPSNTISQVLWNSSSRIKESRGVYIDNSKENRKIFLFACRLFEGSKAYEQNSCVVR